MGLDSVSLEALLLGQQYVKNTGILLTLGRQKIDRNPDVTNKIFTRHNLNHLQDKFTINDWCEKLGQELGYQDVKSLDNSKYENATIIHNMNRPISDRPYVKENETENLVGKFDCIFDGGTTEHIFNCPQVFQNIIDMLKIDGIFISVTCNNNFSGHGMYQFSPEFFLSIFTPTYGMEILHLYLAKNDSPLSEWVDVNSHKGYRNETKLDTKEQVYIITIAKKIDVYAKSLTISPPNQFSYEKIDWTHRIQ